MVTYKLLTSRWRIQRLTMETGITVKSGIWYYDTKVINIIISWKELKMFWALPKTLRINSSENLSSGSLNLEWLQNLFFVLVQHMFNFNFIPRGSGGLPSMQHSVQQWKSDVSVIGPSTVVMPGQNVLGPPGLHLAVLRLVLGKQRGWGSRECGARDQTYKLAN